MRINYRGADKDNNFRLAEICFNEDNAKEVKMMDDIAYMMRVKYGYDIEIVTDGYACCEVEDRDEYEEFVEIYKEVKHRTIIRNKVDFTKTEEGMRLHEELNRACGLMEAFDEIDEDDWTDETSKEHREARQTYLDALAAYEIALDDWLIKAIEDGTIA